MYVMTVLMFTYVQTCAYKTHVHVKIAKTQNYFQWLAVQGRIMDDFPFLF